jgi:hypothetical protein
LRHGLRRGHLAGWRKGAAVKSTALAVSQRGPLGRPQARFGVKLLGAFFTGIRDQRTVEPLRHVHGRLGVVAENGK